MGRFNFGLPDQQTQTKSTNRFTFGLDKPAPNQPKDVVQGPSPDYSYQPKTSQPKQTQGMGDLRQYESTQPLPRLPEPKRDWKDRLSDFGSGFWDTGMHNASQGYHADSAQMYYAMSQDPKNSPEEQAEWKRKYDEMVGHGPKEQTTTSGKVGAVTGEMLGYAPEYLTGGKATEGAAKAINSKLLPKLSPKAQPYADRAVKDSLAFAAIGPMESDTFQEIPGKTATNAALGAGFGVGTKALGEGLKLAGKGVSKGVEKAKGPQLKLPELKEPTPQDALKDAQNAYKRTPSQHDVRQRELEEAFKPAKPDYKVEKKPLQQGINDNLKIKDPLDTTGRVQKQNELESVFGGPRKTESYAVSTGEQRAERELMDGIEQVENYTGHNDILSIYPPGTTIDQAYADIAKKTGIDLPKLMRNWENASKTTQKSREGLDPDYKRLGKVSGVFPELKPRERFKPVSEDVAAAREPMLQNPERRTWTNEDVIKGTTGDIPYPKRVELPKLKKVEQPKLPEPKLQNPKLPLPKSKPNNTGPSSTLEMIAAPKPKGVAKVKETVKSLPELPGKLYTATVDNLHRMSTASKEVKPQDITHDAHKLGLLTRNASGTTEHILSNSLVNREGVEVGEGWQSIVKDIPKNLEAKFNDYLLHKHNIARAGNKKPIFGNKVSAEGSTRTAAEYEKAHPEFKALNQRINKFLSTLSDEWGVGGDLVEADLMKALKGIYPDYVPTYRQLEAQTLSQGSNRVGPAKIIKTAVGGDEKILPPTESIPMLVDKLVKNARKNEAYQGLLKQVRKDPGGMRKYAELAKPDEELTASMAKTAENHGIDGALESASTSLIESPTKGRFLVVMEKGKPTLLKINDFEYWKALKEIARPREMGAIEQTGRKLTQPFKNVVTGYNPFFGVKNVARDIPTYIINSVEKNPAYAGYNVKGALDDILSDSKDFKEFVALGGTRGTFFENTAGGTNLNPLKSVGKFNNLLEAIPRYAEYKNTVIKGGGTYASKLEGIYNAAEVTTNFSRHGDITKMIDSWTPYLNPAVQGLDKFARQAKDKPVQTISKGLATITAPTTALYAVNQLVDKEAYDKLDRRTRDTYYMVPVGDGKFIKIPKSRETGVLFGAFFERLYNQALGKDDSFKGFGTTMATNFSPANPATNNILSPILYNLPKNKDFANRDIVPTYMQGLSPELQYDAKTSKIAKELGEKINASPKQLDYLARSYLGVINQVTSPFMTQNADISGIVTRPFTADSVYSNDVVNDFYTNKEKLDTMYQDAKLKGDGAALEKIEYARSGYNKIASDMSKHRKEIRRIEADSSLSKSEKEKQTRDLQKRINDLAQFAKMYQIPK